MLEQNPNVTRLPPNVDFITGESLSDVRVVDTLIDFDPGHPGPYTGRKYLTENTVRSAARALGMVLVSESDYEEFSRLSSESCGNGCNCDHSNEDVVRAAVQAVEKILKDRESDSGPAKRKPGRPANVTES